MNILAIDPSTVAIGYCYDLGDDHPAVYGSFVLDERDVTKRLCRSLQVLDNLILHAEPTLLVAEVPNTQRHRDGHLYPMGQYGAWCMGVVAGCVLALCHQRSLPLHFWDAIDVRRQLLGGGMNGTSKADAQWYVRVVMGIELPRKGDEVDHDAVDAIALWAAARDNLARGVRTKERVIVA